MEIFVVELLVDRGRAGLVGQRIFLCVDLIEKIFFEIIR